MQINCKFLTRFSLKLISIVYVNKSMIKKTVEGVQCFT